MRHRRFLLLAGVLVVLNLALWLAPQGLALRKIVVSQLFGPRLMRAEVVWTNGTDWRVDRGVIVSASATEVTLREADGRVQPIAISPATHVVGTARFAPADLPTGWRVLVTWQANGAADTVKIEKRGSGHGNPAHGGRRAHRPAFHAGG